MLFDHNDQLNQLSIRHLQYPEHATEQTYKYVLSNLLHLYIYTGELQQGMEPTRLHPVLKLKILSIITKENL